MQPPSEMTKPSTAHTFWEHLDELRSVILRTLGGIVLCAAVAFCFKDTLFAVILAPTHSDFITYHLIGAEPFHLSLVNTMLTEQFITHLRIAAYVGLLMASPYVIYQLMRYLSPALYENERRHVRTIVGSAYLMFILGTVVCYLVLFPLTVRFLGTYQVSDEVTPLLSLQSYTDTLLMMCLVMGIVFELPVLCALLSRMHLLTRDAMRTYRRHAMVAILIVAAVITPTGDVFTLLVVSAPIYLLYELSILLVK